MEEPAFLLPVQRIVRGIEIKDDLLRRLPMRLQEHLDEQPLDRRRIVARLVIPRRGWPAQFQPIQRRPARQWCTIRTLRRKLAGQHRQHRIVPQLVVVVEVLMAQCDADHTLQHQRVYRVLDQFWRPHVSEACDEPRCQSDRPVRLAQQPRLRHPR